ncbi:phage tail protein [Sphingopyxis granuli]|uniref:phage tail protein n=1 Tax=Sphingopyxis granuli TaxID=267128 RepID=UPI001F537CDE|nr:phage tail protein [Sphingopyxis granuli]UNK80426.1 phage tail protein [Sphingopyxis granuli]
MATLVLTVVGGIVGGPVGAAIGAAIGQQADAAIFRPKGREGPRLADLKVQASTYGQQIPQLFGTMRVAGSVIWATDLIERRSKRGGGKGRASVTEYSYAVSLAVALSSRPIRAIRRIWADGNLLRGASGGFQQRCTFRWYDGGEDQPADPLIASALGPASASGFRGITYAVFEELELGAFGNRIPSLTFEVEADAGAIDAGLVGDTLFGEAGRCLGGTRFAGYAASGDRLREALAPLFDADAVRLASDPGGWRLAPADSPRAPVPLAGFREARREEAVRDRVERRRAPLADVPGTIRLRHYDRERDYQLGQQTGSVAGGGAAEQRIDLPAVLSASAARALAQRLAAAAADGRESCVWRMDLAALALPVGAVAIAGDGSRWRIAARTVRDAQVDVELRRHQPLDLDMLPADSGAPVRAPDWPEATALVRAFDLPNLGPAAATAPQVVIAGAGSNAGWRGADTWFVPMPDAAPMPLGTLRPAAALGVLAEPLAPGGALLFDDTGAAIVTLIDPAMELEAVSDALLLGGANRAMIGDELVQFGGAEPLAPGRWRLTRMLRGRAGTESAAAHAAGTPFLLLDDPALLPIPADHGEWVAGGGARLQWAAWNDTSLSELPVPADLRALRPLAPVHGRVRSDGEGGLTIGWTRRSRADGGWRDHVDLPLGENRELYRVSVEPAIAGIGPWDLEVPTLRLAAADVVALAPGSLIAIRQIGDVLSSAPLLLSLK